MAAWEEAVAVAWVKVAGDTEAGPADGQRGVGPEDLISGGHIL